MAKFKVGDRVAVYSREERFTGTVSRVDGALVWVVYARSISPTVFHSKQCRKLKKRVPQEEIWLEYNTDFTDADMRFTQPKGMTGYWHKYRLVK
jgi:hypothetical protein